MALIATNWLSVTIPLYLADGIDILVSGQDATTIRTQVFDAALAVALMGLAVIVVRTASRVLFFTPGRLVESRVKRDLFAAIIAHQPRFIGKWPVGDLFSRVSSDVSLVRLLAGFGTLQSANTTIAMGLALGQMSRISTELASLVLLPIVLGTVVTQVFIRRMYVVFHRLQAEQATISDFILASYRGIATVQGFNAQDGFVARFDIHNRAILNTTLERIRIRTIIGPTFGLAGAVNVFILLSIGGPMAIRGEITLGELVAFMTLINFITVPLRGMSFLLSMIKQAQAALERIGAITVPPPERPDLPNPTAPPTTPPAIRIDNLQFRYPNHDTLALNGITLDIPPGSTLGIFGPTGSGKSTLLLCLSRLFNPPKDTILVDGIDICAIDLDAWRRVTTLVPQRAFLFSESLRDNILLGRHDETVLERVLQLSALKPDISALSSGVDTLVGESGVMLSGGQRQRTALARGLVRDHSLLLLDDVLSSVDHATEHELITTLRAASPGQARPTTVIAAHRISALKHADQIAILNEGVLVDLGSHEELIARPGMYRETWRKQREGEHS